MIQLIYTSHGADGIVRAQVDALLDAARRANQAAGITGIMLYDGIMFVQLLEGDAPIVDDLFARIKNDTRHFNIQPLIREPVGARQFSNWSMAYALYDRDSLRRFGGTMNAQSAVEFAQMLKLGKSFVRNFFADHLLEFSQRS